jgi:hypothetical protein
VCVALPGDDMEAFIFSGTSSGVSPQHHCTIAAALCNYGCRTVGSSKLYLPIHVHTKEGVANWEVQPSCNQTQSCFLLGAAAGRANLPRGSLPETAKSWIPPLPTAGSCLCWQGCSRQATAAILGFCLEHCSFSRYVKRAAFAAVYVPFVHLPQ